MVVINGYSVQLVDATSGDVFSEHRGKQHDEVYAEILDPESEYYIQVQVVGEHIDPKQKICFQVAVDGISMESRTITTRQAGPAKIGLLSRENGVTINKAFRLKNCCACVQNSDGTLNKKDPFAAIGSIIVKISEAVKDHQYLEPTNYKEETQLSDTATINVPYEIGIFSGKKFARSCEGNYTIRIPDNSSRTGNQKCKHQTSRKASYQPGKFLQEINLRYCSCLGLIHAGVLEKPPGLWELFKKEQVHLHGKHSLPQQSPTPTKRVKVDAVYDGQVMVSPAKSIELFDLTIGNGTNSNESTNGKERNNAQEANESTTEAESESEDPNNAITQETPAVTHGASVPASIPTKTAKLTNIPKELHIQGKPPLVYEGRRSRQRTLAASQPQQSEDNKTSPSLKRKWFQVTFSSMSGWNNGFWVLEWVIDVG